MIATGAPYLLFSFAYLLNKKFGIKWIADYRDDWRREREEREERENRRRFNNVNDDWNYPNRYGERGGGGYNGGGR